MIKMFKKRISIEKRMMLLVEKYKQELHEENNKLLSNMDVKKIYRLEASIQLLEDLLKIEEDENDE